MSAGVGVGCALFSWRWCQGTQNTPGKPILQVSSWSLEGHGYSRWSWRWCQGSQKLTRKLYWKFHQNPTSGSLSRLHLSSKSLPGVLEDRNILDGDKGGVRVLKISQGSFTESFIKIHHKEVKTLPIIQVSSWSLAGEGCSWYAVDGVRVLKILQGSFPESFIKVQHQEPCQYSKFPPSLFLESWRKVMFLMELEMVSEYPKYPKETLLKVS